jgi:hypothetical protein
MMNIFVNKLSSYQGFLGSSLVNNDWPARYNGVLYIAAGMGMNSVSYQKGLEQIFDQRQQNMDIIDDSKRKYEQYKEYLLEHIQSLPSHYEFLRDNIYGGVDEHLQA